ncbi:rubrerythrin [hydrocarbon metagenome]|uniref:Rubrerythrin n=1 Tax=hydrocarbon metagenome TaxID=938273 RepID=A0A0W8G995_9ZZZZ
MSMTEKDLMEAFAGESQANRKYLAFAAQADKEGFPQVAKLFRAAAEAETVHAHAHLRAAGGIRTTAENLKEAMAGEIHEFKEMYPPMIEHAKAEGHKAAERSFTYANAVEAIHAKLYQQAAEMMDKLPETDYHVCSVCGYTCEGEAPDSCPVCKAAKKAFSKVV